MNIRIKYKAFPLFNVQLKNWNYLGKRMIAEYAASSKIGDLVLHDLLLQDMVVLNEYNNSNQIRV
jgi:hypothetical protein